LKKCYYLLSILLLFGCNDQKRNNSLTSSSVDSSTIFLKKATDISTPNSEKYKYFKKSYEELKFQKNDSITREKLLDLSKELFRADYNQEFLKSVNLLSSLSISSKDSFRLAQSYRYKGSFYKNSLMYDSSFIYYAEAEKILKKIILYIT
jgi:hypothetical protein